MAFEPIRVAWPEERIVYSDARVLVVDKPRGLPVHGGNPELQDVVTRLGRFLRNSGQSDYLAVHSRLDKDVSGLLLFGRDPENNPALAREFEAHRVMRKYVAIVRDPGLPTQFEMHDRLLPRASGPTQIVKSGGVSAVTRVTVMKRSAGRAMISLEPQTGRRHQLRVQLASRNAAICGDPIYGGDLAPRLMLHAVKVEASAFGWSFERSAPDAFSSFGLESAWTTDRGLVSAIRDAAWLREPLFAKTDTLRLVNGEGDAIAGLAVDAYGPHAVVELFSDEAVSRRADVVRAVAALGAASVYVKCRLRRDLRHEAVEQLAPPTPDWGKAAPCPLLVHEQGVPVEVSLGDGWDTGLYLDQRENRQRIYALASGKTLLNLFAYTGMFSVAAARGGATQTTTVDLSGRALDRARRNFALSDIVTDDRHRFIKADAVEWLARAVRRKSAFDLIVLDPPSFSTTGKGKVFRLGNAWDGLLRDTLSLLRPGGKMLVVSHERDRDALGLRGRILRAAEHLHLSKPAVRDIAQAPDFPTTQARPWPSFSIWVELA